MSKTNEKLASLIYEIALLGLDCVSSYDIQVSEGPTGTSYHALGRTVNGTTEATTAINVYPELKEYIVNTSNGQVNIQKSNRAKLSKVFQDIGIPFNNEYNLDSLLKDICKAVLDYIDVPLPYVNLYICRRATGEYCVEITVLNSANAKIQKPFIQGVWRIFLDRWESFVLYSPLDTIYRNISDEEDLEEFMEYLQKRGMSNAY